MLGATTAASDRCSNRSDKARLVVQSVHGAEAPDLYACYKPGHYAAECKKKPETWSPAAPATTCSARHRTTATPASSTAQSPSPPPPPPTPSTTTGSWTLAPPGTSHHTSSCSPTCALRHTPVTFGNGSIGEATLIGDAYLQPNPGSLIKLTDVLYIPGAADNLLSVSQATKRGFSFSFNDTDCQISKDNQMIAPATPTPQVASTTWPAAASSPALPPTP